MSEQLGDYVLVRQVAGVKNQTFGVQAFLLLGKRNYKLVIWNINREQRILRIGGAL